MGAADGVDDAPQDHDSLVDITPPVEEEPDPAAGGNRWLGPLLVIGVPLALVAAGFAALYYLLFAAPEFPETDSRACPGSVQPLEPLEVQLGLHLPEGARDVHYLTTAADSGKPVLEVSFRMPAAAVDEALEDYGLTEDPRLDNGYLGGLSCGPVDSGQVTTWWGSLRSSPRPVHATVTMPPGDLAQVELVIDG
ncbi:hypothetical protein [Peterkaempfera griseoplana]|uniref:hypothetical protein n=1 Tax=Peterkaempfera griseoplana TaxID=66896 RepID=UPI0006E1B42D|nr:hypothetical protein [Peterkaempfera griseoplana]